jgi:hypothetical protein
MNEREVDDANVLGSSHIDMHVCVTIMYIAGINSYNYVLDRYS